MDKDFSAGNFRDGIIPIPMEEAYTFPIHRWRRGVVVTSLGVSAKLLYVGPG